MRSITVCLAVALFASLVGCGGGSKPEYGVEPLMRLPGTTRQTWAVAPAVDLSGQRAVDPVLQADLLYAQLQQVAGVNAVPVNRVIEVYQALRIAQVQSEEQAAIVCEILGCDALLVPTVTAYDPYEPPKMGASLQLFRRGQYRRPDGVDPRELVRRASPPPGQDMPKATNFVQVVGMYDAANGSVRTEVLLYARGRNDPAGPLKERQYLLEMDRYCGFVYHSLLGELLMKPALAASGN